jgi:hypothetical protein
LPAARGENRVYVDGVLRPLAQFAVFAGFAELTGVGLLG